MKLLVPLLTVAVAAATPSIVLAQSLPAASRAAPGYQPREPIVGGFSPAESGWATTVSVEADVCDGHYSQGFLISGVQTRDEALRKAQSQVSGFDHKMADIARSCDHRPH